MIDDKKKRTYDGHADEEPEPVIPVKKTKEPSKKTVSRKAKPSESLPAGFRRVRMLESGTIKIVGTRTADALISKKRAVPAD